MKNNVVSELFTTIKNRKEIQAIVPMDYSPGMPVLTSRQDELCVEIPFLRYKVTGEKDRTLVYPVRYIAVYVIPEMQLISFEDLAYTEMSQSVDFNKPIGFFRHQSIINLTRKEYNDLRKRTLFGLDELANSLLGGTDFDLDKEKRLIADMSRIVEPSLYPLYKSIAPNFYNKYINNGKDN